MNVAGIAAWGTVDRLEHRHWQAMIDVNLMGPIHVIECFVPPMIAARPRRPPRERVVRRRPRSGCPGTPRTARRSSGCAESPRCCASTCASTASASAWSAPAAWPRRSPTRSRSPASTRADAEFAQLQAHFRKRAVTPEQAAAAILRGVRRNRYLVYTSRDIQAIHLVQRLCPPLYALIMRGMNLAMRRTLPAAAPAEKQVAA